MILDAHPSFADAASRLTRVDGRSIVDLAAAIAQRFGAFQPAQGLADSRTLAALGQARQVVLLLFDGLGERQVGTLIPDGAIAAARSSTLRSVFPSSTAPAISSFASARYPSQHGNPGWFCWSPELGAVVRTLPMDLRGVPESAVAAESMWEWESASTGYGAPVFAIQPAAIADSTFSRHAWSGATRIGYDSASALPEMIEGVLAQHPEGAFVWAYLPHFDTTSHAKGWQSRAAQLVAQRLDDLFAMLSERLSGTDALLLATADHGFIDVPADQQLRLEAFPEMSALLARPLTGEPRVVYCQAAAGRHEAFSDAAIACLGFAFEVVPSLELLDSGCFGPGPISARLAARLGSHTLIARDRYTLVDQLPGEAPASFVGMHGGVHEDELLVPLAAMLRGRPL